jgi:hypothetical protein
MFTACAAMPRSAKDPYLVNEIAFLHKMKMFSGKSKLTDMIDKFIVTNKAMKGFGKVFSAYTVQSILLKSSK